MSHVPPVKKKFLDVVILLVLAGVGGYMLFTRFSSGDPASADRSEDELLLMGLDPQATRIPGRSIMGEQNHDRLTDAVAGRNDQLSDLELMGLTPGSETRAPERPQPPNPIEPPPTVKPPDPGPPVDIPAQIVTLPPPDEVPERMMDDEEVPEVADTLIDKEPPPDEASPSETGDGEIDPEPSSTEGIWVRSSREGSNPIRVEDHVSVDAKQLSEMAGFRNISTDVNFAPPKFNISGVGSGRLGTYVIVDHQMIRLNGQINSPSTPPRAWRLVEATANEVFWEPVE